MDSNCPPIFVMIIALAAILTFFTPRSWVLPVFLAFSTFVGMNYCLLFLGLNFYSVRIFLLLAWLRVLAKGESRGLKSLAMDRALIAFCCSMVLIETFRRGLPGLIYAVANQFYDALGIYFLFRALIREREDLLRVVKWLGVICCMLAGFLVAENLTRHNWLKPMGACTEWVTPRDGKLRCQATFLHAVLAGTFGAVLLPVFIACKWQGKPLKQLAVPACIASGLITVASGSSGPLMTLAAGVTALFAWPLRQRMKSVRWVIFISLLTLHLIMNAPVWALLARVSSITGGSGWHRFNILDTFINHIGDWWLIGTETTNWGWLTEDVANQYCIIAKHGGLLAVILFIRLLVVGFREVGIQFGQANNDRPTQVLLWGFGGLLFAHMVTFFATSYFDQTQVLWLLTLAMIASLGVVRVPVPRQAQEFWQETATDSHPEDEIGPALGAAPGKS